MIEPYPYRKFFEQLVAAASNPLDDVAAIDLIEFCEANFEALKREFDPK